MSLYSSAVKRPVTTIMVFVGILVLGAYSLMKIPIDFFPKMDPPMISVFTFYNGANASDIEENITRRLEDNFGTLTNLKKITSSSKDNISLITLEFEWGKNLDEATNEIRDAIDRIENFLPEDADKPSIFKFSSSTMPVMMFSATAKENYAALSDILEEKLVNPLNRIEGVGSVSLYGSPERAIMIDFDPGKLDAYNLTLEQIAPTIAAENINIPAGKIEMGQTDYPIRVQSEFKSSDEIKNIIVSNYNGNPVYLKDVATVRDDLKKRTVDDRTNGQRGIRIMIQKQSDANTVAIAEAVKNKIEELKPLLPDDVEITTIFNTADYISNSIGNLSKTLLYAGVFVVLVVLFFLGRWRATIIIILTIPVSLIVAFIYLYFVGESINIVSLSSLSIAIGMVVDDAIVVLENITRNLEKGTFPKEAAIYGTNEVSLAVVATTLTVVAVFLPMTMVGGFVGVMFKSLGFIVSITVSVSTLAALSLTPMLSSQILKIKKWKDNSLSGRLASMNDRMLTELESVYGKILRVALKRRRWVVISAIAIFLVSILLVGMVGGEFMPASDNSRILAAVQLAQGAKLETTTKIAREYEKVVREKYPEVDVISTSAGAGDQSSFISIFEESGTYIINFTFGLVSPDDRDRDMFEIAEEMRKDLQKVPEIEKFDVDPGGSRGSMFMGGSGGGSNIEVKIFGYDFDKTYQLAESIKNEMEGVEGVTDILISRDKEKPELQVVLDRDKLARLNLNSATVSAAIRNRMEGLVATRYREEGEEYDVILRYDEKYRKSLADLENITIPSPAGKKIKLKEVGTVKQFYSPPNIEREDKERIIKVSALVSGSDLQTVTDKIKAKLATMYVPEGVDVEIGGSAKDMKDSFQDLALLLMLSIVLVYIVMASQFESLREPFIIMFSLPFAFTGVFLALYITGTTLNVISFVGMVMLVGIVVKNGIVLVDYTNLMRDRGYALGSSIVMAGKSRLRPVLMTTLTTLLAMVPLAFSTGEGSESWRPMGVAIIGGLLFSTLVTLVLIPVVYGMFGRREIKRNRKSIRKQLAKI